MDDNKNKETNEAQNINLRSEEVKEILGRPPRWMIRWGITVIFIIIAGLIIGSWFFKYPDVVPSTITVTTENPPSPIISRASGKIEHLFVKDKQKVEKGQPLAVIEDAAHYKDVLSLENKIENFKSALRNGNIKRADFNFEYTLGDIQSYYASFLKRLEDYEHFEKLNYHSKKIASLKKEEERYRQHYQRLLNQREISKKEYELAKKQFQRDSILFERSVIPEAKYEQSETTLLQKRYALEQSEVSLSSARIQLSTIEENIIDLELKYEQQKNTLEVTLWEAYDNLKGAVSRWKRTFYMDAPITGKVTFTNYWSENQYVETGKRIMTVIPENEGEIIGKMTLPFQGAGKVKEGQTVNIRFANYPHMEYGMVKGVVRSISLVPEEQAYTVEVGLPDGLTTFYGEELEFSQQMQGTAEVITEDTRLLERIIRPLRFIMNKNLK
ncbi:MAG: HlyD family secretion protein [Bacteroidales bacterium]